MESTAVHIIKVTFNFTIENVTLMPEYCAQATLGHRRRAMLRHRRCWATGDAVPQAMLGPRRCCATGDARPQAMLRYKRCWATGDAELQAGLRYRQSCATYLWLERNSLKNGQHTVTYTNRIHFESTTLIESIEGSTTS